MNEIVRVSCIRHIYPDKTDVHLCGLDMVVQEQERVAVLGPSGSGKTTLLKHVLGLLQPAEGLVRVFGVDPVKDRREIRERVGFVMQNVEEQLVNPTVFDEIAFAPLNYGHSLHHATDLVEKVLAELNITNLKDKVPHYLSGGQKRKVALASALVLDPELLVLDEPFEGMDPLSRTEFIELINQLVRDRKMTLILTLHDVNIVPSIADVVFLLKFGGEISRRGTPRQIFENVKELATYNLEPPILTKLFLELKKQNPDLSVPVDVQEALKEIEKLLES
jgi:cobalt/nickel transport system ATP-binding protein